MCGCRKGKGMNWREISNQNNLTEEFIREHQNRLDWDILSCSYSFSEENLEEFKQHLQWELVSSHQTLSFPFILKNWEKVNLLRLKKNKQVQLTQKEWTRLRIEEKLTLYRMIEKGNPNWSYIAREMFLEEDFIETYKEKLNLIYVSQWQMLSEAFIKKYRNRVHWESISCRQNISESFIIEMKDDIDWTFIEHNPFLSKEIKEKYIKEYKKESVL